MGNEREADVCFRACKKCRPNTARSLRILLSRKSEEMKLKPVSRLIIVLCSKRLDFQAMSELSCVPASLSRIYAETNQNGSRPNVPE